LSLEGKEKKRKKRKKGEGFGYPTTCNEFLGVGECASVGVVE
jgi:hypothetical protein